MNFKDLIKKTSRKEDLTKAEAAFAATEIMEGSPTPVQVATLLALLAAKGESLSEIIGFASIMREKAAKIDRPKDKLIVDVVGTGGDGKHTLNVSTVAAIVVAANDLVVAKHGNRAVSSSSGSADVLEKLGVNISTTPEETSKILNDVGLAFLFAQKFHPAMKNVGPIRKDMGVRTIFNILGPLTNPAKADIYLLGVFAKHYVKPLTETLQDLGAKAAFVVHGEDGLDEISISERSYFCQLKDGEITEGYINPEDIIGTRYAINEIKGGDALYNASLVEGILKNKIKGAMLEIVLINAGAALMIAGKSDDLESGYKLAKRTVESGKAIEKLEALCLATQR